MSTSVTCDYCGQPAELVGGLVIYPHRHDLRNAKFWRCEPCGAYVGTHANSRKHVPFGRLAKPELRALKQQVHAAFDPLWQGRETSRSSAYGWLAEAMGIPHGECHIGKFDEQRCRDALVVLRAVGTAALDRANESVRIGRAITG